MAESEADAETDSRRHQTYLQHRETLDRGEFEQSRLYDKHVLTLASGALALSLVYVREVAPKPILWSFPILLGTCACFAFSIISTLISFVTSQKAHERSREAWDQAMRSPEAAPD